MVYLDHNASSPLRPSAKRTVLDALEHCGNASSVHSAGRDARARIERARESVARFADAEPGSVVFVSGGSEANSTALRGAVAGALAIEDRITRIFVSAIEHESVRAVATALAETVPGLKVSEIPVTPNGTVDVPAFRLKLMQGKGRVLVSIMAANNETGAVQDLVAIVDLVRRDGSEGALLHVDAVQAAGRMAISFARLGVDYMTLSAHKLGGPQGTGALLLKGDAPFAPLISGGGQEMGRRSGTENVAAIAGFGAAAEDVANFAAEAERLSTLRDRFERELKERAPEAVIFGDAVPRLPNTSNFAVPGLAAETALIALDLDGIAVSSGSACSSGKVKPSHVLAAMGVDESLARCGLRVSFGWNNGEDDVDAVIASLARLIARRKAMAA
jgi:cysteine desulfurase